MQVLPSRAEYISALTNLGTFIIPQELKPYEAVRAKTGGPKIYSGGFAIACQIEHPTTKERKALRLFDQLPNNLEQRYAEISPFVFQHRSTGYFVRADYYAAGIVVNRNRYPIVVMDWVDGVTLDAFIRKNIASPEAMRPLPDRFAIMMQTLRRIGAAHGSLSGENIMAKPDGTLMLVDYDGMYVPRLQGMNPIGAGQRNFEHPQRFEPAYRTYFGDYQDHFSSIALYLTLKALVLNPTLHERYNDDGHILFRKDDYVNPDASPIMREMETHNELTPLVARFRQICKNDLHACPSLDEFLKTEQLIRKQSNVIPAPPVPAPQQATPRISASGKLNAHLFISYRRNASRYFAPFLAEELRKRCEGSVFIDLDSIGIGIFPQKILDAIAHCDYFLVVISPGTLDKERLANPKDWMHREIAEALRLGKPIVQIAEDKTPFAVTDELPPELTALADHNGVRIYEDQIPESVTRLIRMLQG